MDQINAKIAVKNTAITLVRSELKDLVQVKSEVSLHFQGVMDTAFKWINEFDARVKYVVDLNALAGGKDKLTINNKVYTVLKLAKRVEKKIDTLFGKVRNAMLHLQYGTKDNEIFQSFWKITNSKRFSHGVPKFDIPS